MTVQEWWQPVVERLYNYIKYIEPEKQNKNTETKQKQILNVIQKHDMAVECDE